jgi:hypothetical protein
MASTRVLRLARQFIHRLFTGFSPLNTRPFQQDAILVEAQKSLLCGGLSAFPAFAMRGLAQRTAPSSLKRASNFDQA